MFHLIIWKAFTLLVHERGDAIKMFLRERKPETVASKRIKIDSEKKKKEEKKYAQSIRVLKYFYRIWTRIFFPNIPFQFIRDDIIIRKILHQIQSPLSLNLFKIKKKKKKIKSHLYNRW